MTVEKGSTVIGNSLAVEKSLSSKAALFCDLSTSFLEDQQLQPGWSGFAGFGAGYLLTSDFQLYGGVRFGFENASDQYNPYFGLTWRY